LQNITGNTILKYDSKPTARIMRKRIFTDLMTGKITPLICLKDELLEREGTKKKRRSVNVQAGQ